MEAGRYPTCAIMDDSFHHSATDALDTIFKAVTRDRWSMRCVLVYMYHSRTLTRCHVR